MTLGVVFYPRVMKSSIWRATVTPLASIIGSGFLVLGPILHNDFGPWAPLIMAVLCVTAYLFGASIRYNIGAYSQHTDAVPRHVRITEEIASAALAAAYIISITYYLNLFGSFAVSLTDLDGPVYGRIVTTAVVLFIGTFGWLNGLSALENMEEGAVGIKLAIIAGMLVGLSAFAWEVLQGTASSSMPEQEESVRVGWHSLFVVFGLVITVQGFETSRYLGNEYEPRMRIRTMRYAQWTAAGIYLIYIGLMAIGFFKISVPEEETAIIDMTRDVAPILPAMLVCAALAAQFSAAIADTSGCGGLTHELTRGWIKPSHSYLIIMACAIAITWSANVYSIISYASKAFAVYYALQCCIAVQFAWSSGNRMRAVFHGCLGLLAAAVAVLGISPE